MCAEDQLSQHNTYRCHRQWTDLHDNNPGARIHEFGLEVIGILPLSARRLLFSASCTSLIYAGTLNLLVSKTRFAPSLFLPLFARVVLPISALT